MKMKYLWLVQIPAYKAFLLELSWECKLQCVFVKSELDCNHNNFRPWPTMTCLLWVDINPFLKENWRPKEEEEGEKV